MAAMYSSATQRSGRRGSTVGRVWIRSDACTNRRCVRGRSGWSNSAIRSGRGQPLGGDTDVDVAIVGGGYTGLWSAYSLLRADPSLRVIVIEREMVGFGASGRNGGWCVGELAGGLGGAVATLGSCRRASR